MMSLNVIPAEAGIHGENGTEWIPAYAGMTNYWNGLYVKMISPPCALS